MDSMLCDELIIEIFHRLPPPSFYVSLVSKRWLRLYRHSKTSLSLILHHPQPPLELTLSLSSLLSHYPFLSSLSLSLSSTLPSPTSPSSSFDGILLSASSSCPNLKRLRFLVVPVSLSSLFSLSSSSAHLTSLTIPLSRPLSFIWVPSFPSLKDLSVVLSNETGEIDDFGNWVFDDFDVELQLESLCVSGIGWSDVGMGWLWRNCVKLRKLYLRSCEGVGDGGSFSSFAKCLQGLIEVELRSCRGIVDMVLLKLAENSAQLNSLLVYDGGSKDGLLHFINNCKAKLEKLDLRLPLDLENEHLSAMALHFRSLLSLRLQSCCLVSGDGLKIFSLSLSNNLEELALINCDVLDRVPGLLTTLGQNLRKLRRLDLSYNELIFDKELVSMLISCNCVVELKLRGCKGLTNVALVSMTRICKNLESIDIVRCCGIDAQAVEEIVLGSKRLKRLLVEPNKVSNAAKIWASSRFIEVIA